MRPLTSTAHVIQKPWESVLVFLLAFFLLSVFLYLIDFVPEPETGVSASPSINSGQATPTITVDQVTVNSTPSKNLNLIAGPAPTVVARAGNAPTRVVISKVGVDISVSTPHSTSLSALDTALLSGAVHYPGTANLGEQGSVLLFGHQSYLPIIHNQAFKAFNNVQKLVAGDTISVYSGSTEYRYSVRSVDLVTVDFGSIDLETTGSTLTLVTCNSLGEKEERYIVRADFIGTFN